MSFIEAFWWFNLMLRVLSGTASWSYQPPLPPYVFGEHFPRFYTWEMNNDYVTDGSERCYNAVLQLDGRYGRLLVASPISCADPGILDMKREMRKVKP